MWNIRDLMRPAFAALDGGLFSASEKADVGDVADRMKAMGVSMMSWADPFAPDPSIPESVKRAAIEAIEGGFPAHYIMPIGSMDLKKLIARRCEQRFGVKLDPQRNIITRAVGTAFDVEPDVGSVAWSQGEVMLLCSDGLCGQISDIEILDILKTRENLQQACDALIEAALAAGGTDNITVVLVENRDEEEA